MIFSWNNLLPSQQLPTGSDKRTVQNNITVSSTPEPLNSGPLNSGRPLFNRQARLDQWIFHTLKPLISGKPLNSRRFGLDEKIHY